MAVIALVLSLGSHLHFDGHRTCFPLPFIVINTSHCSTAAWPHDGSRTSGCLPFSSSPSCWTPSTRPSPPIAEAAEGVPRPSPVLLAVVVLLPLVPAWPYPAAAAAVPAWFTSSSGPKACRGSTALVYPIASSSNDQSMLWQAMGLHGVQDARWLSPCHPRAPTAPTPSTGNGSPLQAALATCRKGGVNFVTGFYARRSTGSVEAMADPHRGRRTERARRGLRREPVHPGPGPATTKGRRPGLAEGRTVGELTAHDQRTAKAQAGAMHRPR